MKIKVIDGIMSAGKTTYAIDMIKKDRSNNYMYITPYLDECKRIKSSCSNRNFIEPDAELFGSKTRHFKYMIKNDFNIVSTHSLFKGVDQETKQLLQQKNYILVLDEVLDVVEKVNISSKDLENILKNYVEVNSNNEMIWTDKEYSGKYDEYKALCEEGSLLLINGVVVMWSFPVDVFNYFKEVYILTYMFDAQIQKYYFDYYNLEYDYKTIDRVEDKYFLTDKGCSSYENFKKQQAKQLIEIYQGRSNEIGSKKFTLSKSWFEDPKNSSSIEELKKNIFNFFKNTCKTKTELNGWTTFKDTFKQVKGKGYTKGFIPINMRATNDFQDRCSLAYPVDRYIDPYLLFMFKHKNIEVDQDKWALSEMLQWIWRGSIRKNEPMKLYIPSARMRNIFLKWLDNEI